MRDDYAKDRAFTDFVHEQLAVPIIYSKLGWNPVSVETEFHNQRDMQDGVDYQAVDALGFKVTIQERFRDAWYNKYNDFTIRYTREHSSLVSERKSEFFKIDAAYFIYGITNGKKFLDQRHTLTDLNKYIVYDVNLLKNLFRDGKIRVPENYVYESQVKVINGEKVLYTGLTRNKDDSSEFISIDPNKLKDVIGDQISSLVLLQKGYYKESIDYTMEPHNQDFPRVAENDMFNW